MPCSSLVFVCLLLVTGAAERSWALTESEQAQVVQKHNEYRAGVSPAASDMLKMKWDKTLENMAQAYAKKCIWAHNPNRGFIGENLFMTTSPALNVEQAVEDWYKEDQYYNFNANTCAENKMCGHYTQVVWASTYKVGCGAHFCEKLEGIEETNANLLVCNYDPPGNMEGSKPYTPGSSCSKCSASNSCVNNLCEQIVDLEDTTSEFLTSGDSAPVEWPSSPSISESVSIDFDATMSLSLNDKGTLPSKWPSTPGLTSTSNIDTSMEELSRPHLTTAETSSPSPTQSHSPISSKDVEEHQASSIRMETDSFRVSDLSTSFTTSSVVEIDLGANSLPPIILEQETTPRRTDTIEGSSPENSRVADLSYLSGITEQGVDSEVTTSDFPTTTTTILPTTWPSSPDLRRTSANIDSEITTSSSRTKKDIISTNGPSTPDLKTSANVDTTQEQVTTLHISTEETMPPPQTTPQSFKTSTEARLDQKKTLAPYTTTKAAASLRSHSSTTVRTSPRTKINQDQNRQQPIRSDKATSPGRTHALNVPSSDNSIGHSQMYQSDDAGRRSTDLYWSTSCCGVRKGLCVLPLYRQEGGSVDSNCLQRTVVKPQLCSRSWGNGCCGGTRGRFAVHGGAQWAVNQPWPRYLGQTLPRYGGVRWHTGGRRSHRIYREVHEQPCLGAQADRNKTGCYTWKDSEDLPTPALLVEDSDGSSSQQPGQNTALAMQPGSIVLLTVFVFIWFCLY